MSAVEEAIKLLPKKWEAEIDVEGYFPDWDKKAVIPLVDLEGFDEAEYDYIKDRIRDQLLKKGYSIEEAEKAVNSDEFWNKLYDIPIEHYVIIPDIGRVRIKWERTDPWRGYYDLDLPDIKKAKDNEPVSLYLHYVARDPEENERYINMAKEVLKRLGFDAIAVALPTSNVFATNVSLIVKPKKRRWDTKAKEFIKEFDDIYTDVYTKSFSIFEGKTYPIDFDEFLERIKAVAKEKLGEVI